MTTPFALGPYLEDFIRSTSYASAVPQAENRTFDSDWRVNIRSRLHTESRDIPPFAFSPDSTTTTTDGESATTFSKDMFKDLTNPKTNKEWLLVNAVMPMQTDDGFNVLGWRLDMPVDAIDRQFSYSPIPKVLLVFFHPSRGAIQQKIKAAGGVFTSQMAALGNAAGCYTTVGDRMFPWDMRYVAEALGYKLTDGFHLLEKKAVIPPPPPAAEDPLPAPAVVTPAGTTKKGKKAAAAKTAQPAKTKETAAAKKKAAAAAAAEAAAAAATKQDPPPPSTKAKTPKATRRRVNPLTGIVQTDPLDPQLHPTVDGYEAPKPVPPPTFAALLEAAQTSGGSGLFIVHSTEPIRQHEPTALPRDIAETFPTLAVPAQMPLNPMNVLLDTSNQSIKEWPIVENSIGSDTMIDRMMTMIEDTDDADVNPLLPQEQAILAHAKTIVEDPIKLAMITIQQILRLNPELSFNISSPTALDDLTDAMLGDKAMATGAIDTMDACILAMVTSMALVTRCASSPASKPPDEFKKPQ